jgi:hypothetical protein
MKVLCFFLLFSGLLSAQNESFPPSPFDGLPGDFMALVKYVEVLIEASSIEKTTSLTNEDTDYNPTVLDSFASPGNVGFLAFGGNGQASVKRRSAVPAPIGSTPFPYSAVDPVIAPFYGSYTDGQTLYVPSYRPGSAMVASGLTTVQPVAPPDPQMIFLDGLGNSLIAVDLTTLTVVGQVVVPSTTGPFGIRPSATGSASEVWVLNSGNEVSAGAEVSIVNVGTQSLVTNILTPSIPPATSAVPTGIVFTNDGAAAFETFKYLSPDSSGNNGALLVFDAVGRTVTSTVPLKYAPTALVMAPDGLTAYILSGNGMITYYDVLSGTADLSVSTYTPGMSGGYPGNPVFIHPDGTRLFWNVNYLLEVFDLTTRQVTNQFNSGLPSTSAASMTMSQDGGRVYMSNGSGAVVIVDTQYGTVLNSYQRSSAVQVFGGPPVAP